MTDVEAVESSEENFTEVWKAAEAELDADEAIAEIEETPEAEEAPEAPETEEAAEEAPDAAIPEEEEPEAPAEEEKPEEEASEEEEEKPKKKGGEIEEIDDDFLELAKSKGLEVINRKVVSHERAKLWKRREKMQAEVNAEAAQARQQIERHVATLEEKYAPAVAVMKAMEADDLDGVAVAMGKTDWNDLNNQALQQRLSPEHKRIQALTKEVNERKEREKAAAEQAQQEYEARAKAAKRQESLEALSDDIGDLDHEGLASFSKDPAFVQGVHNHLSNNWDGHETISVQEAANLAYLDAKKLHAKLDKHFGGSSRKAASVDDATVPATGGTDGKKRRKPPKTISQSQVADASGTAELDITTPEGDEAWLKESIRLMQDAGS